MRILIISDIHANVTALEAVLEDAGTVDETWCLGDLVGYGPDPNEVIERLRAIPKLICFMGNHDAAVAGLMPFVAFNEGARKALQWHKKVLAPDNLKFLDGLPIDMQVHGDVSLVHGSPRDPIWEYVINTLIARLNFDVFTTSYCFVGHSHVQCIFRLEMPVDRVTLDIPKAGETIKLAPRAFLNPGSVGQPRDRDPRAAYAIYDPDEGTWIPKRVSYDVPAVQKRIRAAKLPEKHAVRLAEGW